MHLLLAGSERGVGGDLLGAADHGRDGGVDGGGHGAAEVLRLAAEQPGDATAVGHEAHEDARAGVAGDVREHHGGAALGGAGDRAGGAYALVDAGELGVGVDGAVGDDELGGVVGEEVEGVAQVADARDASLASARAGRVGHVLSVRAPAQGDGLIVVQEEVRAEAVLTW